TNQSLNVPQNLMDYYALLKNEELFNNYESAMGTITADDDFFVTTETFNRAVFATERNAYIWKDDIYENELRDLSSWTEAYSKIYITNIVLEGIEKFRHKDEIMYNLIKGTALFHRGLAFYNLIQIFCPAYDSSSAEMDMGIVLRLSPDMEKVAARASLQASYDQVFKDLEEALDLLPIVPPVQTHPSKVAVHALLARVNLAIHRFDKALIHAEIAIDLGPSLTDFNNLSPTISVISTEPIEECLFMTSLSGTSFISRRNAIISEELYQMYENNDLRKSKYFNIETNELRFRGTFDRRGNKFSGLTMGEVFLIAAEASVRQNDTQKSCLYLNQLLQKRYLKDTYVDYSSTIASDILEKILVERRKELVFRGLRYTDIKRYNKYDKRNISVTRVIDNIEYVLPPNSKRYVFPIPKQEVKLNNIPQNER